MFKNDMLETLINTMPAEREKFAMTMLFALIDGYLAGTLSKKDFIHDLPIILNKQTYI